MNYNEKDVCFEKQISKRYNGKGDFVDEDKWVFFDESDEELEILPVTSKCQSALDNSFNLEDKDFYQKIKDQWKTFKKFVGTNKENSRKKLENISDKLLFDKGFKNIMEVCDLLVTHYQNLIQERNGAFCQLQSANNELLKLRQEKKWMEKKVMTLEQEKNLRKDLKIYKKNMDKFHLNTSLLQKLESEIVSLKSENGNLRKQIDELKLVLLDTAIKKGRNVIQRENISNCNVDLICDCKKIAFELHEQKKANLELKEYVNHVLLKMIKYNPKVLEVNLYD